MEGVAHHRDDSLGLAQTPSQSESLDRCELVLHMGVLATVSARRLTVADYQICLPSVLSLSA